MAKPAPHPKPDLSRLSTRLMAVPRTRHLLEQKLLEWINEILSQTRHPYRFRGRPMAMYLLSSAEGIDDILTAPSPMASSAGPGQQTITAKFWMGGMHDGNWFVEHIKFAPRLSAMQKKVLDDNKEAEHQALKDRLLKEYQEKNERSPKFLAFPVQKYLDNWQKDIQHGYYIVQNKVDQIHEDAQKEASIPDNPYTVKDMATSMVGLKVSALASTGHRAEQLGKAYEIADKTASGASKFLGIKEDVEAINKFDEENGYLKGGKSLGDVITERAIDLASDMPGIGPFVKGFAGMFFDFASANYAGAVTKIRCRIYCWYIAGFIGQLVNVPSDTPVTKFDTKYKQLGTQRASFLTFDAKMHTQMALMHYASDHYTSGDWGGTRLENPHNWSFPDDYYAHWSPRLLAQAMSVILCQKQYLLD